MNQDDRQLAGDWARVLRDVVKARVTGREPEDVQAERHARERKAAQKGRTDMIDLDDVSNCPLAEECSACGGAEFAEELFVATLTSPVGVYCITLCPPCTWRSTSLGSVPVATAVERSLDHCGHLGITADQMAAAMEEEETWPDSR